MSMIVSHADQNLSRSLGDRLFLTLYFWSHKIPSAACFLLRAADAGIRSAVTGAWLGILTPQLMGKLDVWYYTRGFEMYREREYNRSGLYEWEQAIVNKYFAGLPSVLIAVGAGAGREMLALNRMGIRVDGFEYNPALVQLGNTLLTEDGWAPSIYLGPANGVPPGETKYGGVIVGWGTYTLIAGRESRISLLRQVRARCIEGAPLLLSFYHRSGDSGSYRMTALMANSIRTLLRRSKVEIGDTLTVGYAHRFTEREIADEMTAGGFKPVLFKSQPYAHAVGIAV